MQQPLPNNQDIQQSLEFMCTLHRIHLHHLLGQVIAADPQHKFQQRFGRLVRSSNDTRLEEKDLSTLLSMSFFTNDTKGVTRN